MIFEDRLLGRRSTIRGASWIVRVACCLNPSTRDQTNEQNTIFSFYLFLRATITYAIAVIVSSLIECANMFRYFTHTTLFHHNTPLLRNLLVIYVHAEILIKMCYFCHAHVEHNYLNKHAKENKDYIKHRELIFSHVQPIYLQKTM